MMPSLEGAAVRIVGVVQDAGAPVMVPTVFTWHPETPAHVSVKFGGKHPSKFKVPAALFTPTVARRDVATSDDGMKYARCDATAGVVAYTFGYSQSNAVTITYNAKQLSEFQREIRLP